LNGLQETPTVIKLESSAYDRCQCTLLTGTSEIGLNPSLANSLVYPLVFWLRREPVFSLAKRLQDSQWRSAIAVRHEQFRRVSSLVEYFRATHSGYRSLLEDLGVEKTTELAPEDLERLPILEKDHLRKFYDNKDIGTGWSGTGQIRLSGGSTGKPVVVVADVRASAMSQAARVVCQGWYDIKMGDRQIRLWGRPLAGNQTRERWKDRILNRIRLDSLSLEAGSIGKTVAVIRKFGAEYIYGYASLIRLLADRLDDKDISELFLNLKAVITTSETLPDYQQRLLERRFSCPVVDEYGCSEVDIISFQCPQGQHHIVADNALVEIKRFGEEPPGYGQVLVTDLNNQATPVIRYRLGDLAPLDKPQCPCGRGWPCMGKTLGRAQGQYVRIPEKGLVHSQFIVYIIEKLVAAGTPIESFRVIQDANFTLRLLLVPRQNSQLDLFLIQKRLEAEGRPILGSAMKWSIEEKTASELTSGQVNKFLHFESRVSSTECS